MHKCKSWIHKAAHCWVAGSRCLYKRVLLWKISKPLFLSEKNVGVTSNNGSSSLLLRHLQVGFGSCQLSLGLCDDIIFSCRLCRLLRTLCRSLQSCGIGGCRGGLYCLRGLSCLLRCATGLYRGLRNTNVARSEVIPLNIWSTMPDCLTTWYNSGAAWVFSAFPAARCRSWMIRCPTSSRSASSLRACSFGCRHCRHKSK